MPMLIGFFCIYWKELGMTLVAAGAPDPGFRFPVQRRTLQPSRPQQVMHETAMGATGVDAWRDARADARAGDAGHV